MLGHPLREFVEDARLVPRVDDDRLGLVAQGVEQRHHERPPRIDAATRPAWRRDQTSSASKRRAGIRRITFETSTSFVPNAEI